MKRAAEGELASLAVADAAGEVGAVGPQQRAGEIAFVGVSKRYASAAGPVQALDDIHLTIPSGRIVGIIGRSGAGKSSLLRTINRLESPTSGRVLVDGHDIATLDERGLVALRRRIGMIFQHFNLLSSKTVAANIALPLRVAGFVAADIQRRVDELLTLVGLDGKQAVYPGRLSGGQKQRVGIARALVHSPEILLCDEATSALDPETTQSILALLRKINQSLGLTIVLITHEMEVIRDICDHVVVLERGRIVEQGEVWKVFGDPVAEATRALLAPLQHGLPDALALSLSPLPPTQGRYARVLALAYRGDEGREPDFAQIGALLQGEVRLLHGSLERIQGRPVGRLVIAVTSAATVDPQILVEHRAAHRVETLGYGRISD